ncbi:MAG: hypothetical protein Q8O31_01630, partial [Rhodocyclaceae bacterium]|nr:hypothetical protein [Rhodocyclaceae bacterium]
RLSCPPLEGEGDCHVLPLKGRETVMSAIWHVAHYKPHIACFFRLSGFHVNGHGESPPRIMKHAPLTPIPSPTLPLMGRETDMSSP